MAFWRFGIQQVYSLRERLRPSTLRTMLLVMLLPTTPLTQAAENATILIWGDSLAAAHGIERNKSWPALLEQRLEERGLPYHLVNASRSGETTSGGLRRLPTALNEHDPAVTLLQLGGNDGLRGQPPQLIRSNLAQMIELTKESGSRVILIGIRIPPNYGQTYSERFAQVYPQLAEEYAISLVPFLLEGIWNQKGMMQDDGIHPTAEAQPQILELVWEELEELISGQ